MIYDVIATGCVVNNDVISWVCMLYVNYLKTLFNNYH